MNNEEIKLRIYDLQKKINTLKEMLDEETPKDPDIVMKENMLPEALELWNNKGALTGEQREAIRNLPWGTLNNEQRIVDLKEARKTLDNDHYGMAEVKEKILQCLAIRKRIGNSGKSILLVGAPGTGKTTIAKSIARAMGVGFHKISCQGLVSQWELLGSSVGWKNARQGYIVDAVQRSGNFNSVICLDEVDKFDMLEGKNPQMSLLSVLDTTNNMFVDNFIQIPIDLSKITFILTANNIEHVSPILLDRVDVIYVEGYKKNEKKIIMNDYILPQLYKNYKIAKNEVVFRSDAVDAIIDASVSPGVREIKKAADNAVRKAIYLLDMGAKTIPITEGFVRANKSKDSQKTKKEIGFRI